VSSSSSFSRRRFIAAVVGPLSAACGPSLSAHESAKAFTRSSMISTTPQSSVSSVPRRSGVQQGHTSVYDEKGRLVEQFSWIDHGFGRRRC